MGAPEEACVLGATLVVALAFAVVTSLVPLPFVLPTLGLAVIFFGLATGAYALFGQGRPGLSKQTALDIAGMLVLFGFAAAVVSDKSEAIRLLVELTGARV